MRDPMMPLLTEADYAKINKTLDHQQAWRRQIQMALEAGIPCQEQEEACQANIAALEKLKAVYFSDKP